MRILIIFLLSAILIPFSRFVFAGTDPRSTEALSDQILAEEKSLHELNSRYETIMLEKIRLEKEMRQEVSVLKSLQPVETEKPPAASPAKSAPGKSQVSAGVKEQPGPAEPQPDLDGLIREQKELLDRGLELSSEMQQNRKDLQGVLQK